MLMLGMEPNGCAPLRFRLLRSVRKRLSSAASNAFIFSESCSTSSCNFESCSFCSRANFARGILFRAVTSEPMVITAAQDRTKREKCGSFSGPGGRRHPLSDVFAACKKTITPKLSGRAKSPLAYANERQGAGISFAPRLAREVVPKTECSRMTLSMDGHPFGVSRRVTYLSTSALARRCQMEGQVARR